MLDFENDVKIDSSQLDVECVRQAETFGKYAREQVKLSAESDRRKEALEMLKAELYIKALSDPQRYGLPKQTEATIQAWVLLQPEFKQAMLEYGQAKYDADMAKIAVQGLNVKKDMLQELAKLMSQQYFAAPTVPRDLPQELAKIRQQSDTYDMVANALNTGGGSRRSR